MTALWISLSVVAVLLLVWRLRVAANTVDRILREERERAEREDATEHDGSRAEHHNR